MTPAEIRTALEAHAKEWIARMETTPRTSEFVDATDMECWCCGKKTDLVTLRGQHRSVDLCSVCIRSQ